MTILHMQEEIRVYDYLKRGILALLIVVFLILLGVNLRSTPLSLTTTRLEGFVGEPLVLEGSASAESVIQISANEQLLGTTTTASTGRWSLSIDTPEDAGTYSLFVLASDGSGSNMGKLEFEDQLVIHSSQLEPAWMPPTLDSLSIEAGTPPYVTISGTASSKSRVMLRLDGIPLTIATTDESGGWSYYSKLPAGNEKRTLTIEELSSVGVSIPNSLVSETVRLVAATTVDKTVEQDVAHSEEAEQPPVADETLPDSSAEPIPTKAANVEIPTAEPVAASIAELTITDVIQINGFQRPIMRVTGRGEAGISADLTLNGDVLTTLTIDESGAWLWEGVVDDYAKQSWQLADSEGQLASYVLQLEKPVIVPLTIMFADGIASGTGTPDSITLLSLDGVDLAAVKVDENGVWMSESIDAAIGAHRLSAATLDVDGEVATSAEFDFTIGTQPHIITITDRGGNSYKLIGNAAPETSVQLQLNGAEIAVVETDENGQWEWFGYHNPADVLEYVAIDANNLASQPYRLTDIDTVSIEALSIDHNNLESGVEISGVAEPNHLVQLLMDGVIVAALTTDATTGVWEWQSILPDYGWHTVIVQMVSAENTIIAATSSKRFARYSPVEIDVDAFQADAADGKIELYGTATPQGLVSIIIDGRVRKNAIVDDAGNWAWSGSANELGNHTIQLNALTPFGEIIASGELISFNVE
ncbi:MAG: hypothetical protein ACPG8W_08660 [Candidatus Promineifilaceae bacterium]